MYFSIGAGVLVACKHPHQFEPIPVNLFAALILVYLLFNYAIGMSQVSKASNYGKNSQGKKDE